METQILEDVLYLVKPLRQQLNEINDSLSKVFTNHGLCIESRHGPARGEPSAPGGNPYIKRESLNSGTLRKNDEPETMGSEDSVDLITFSGQWLAQILQRENGGLPSISKAYRTGCLNNPRSKFPWDSLITLTDPQKWKKILEISRGNGHLQYQNMNVCFSRFLY